MSGGRQDTPADRLRSITERIANACLRAGRKPEDVTLIAVSKEQPDDLVAAFYALGVRNFGENKVQALSTRVALAPTLTPTLTPTPERTLAPTLTPTPERTPTPTLTPTPERTLAPTPEPTLTPTPEPIHWHAIGPLQTNKAKDIARIAAQHDLLLHTIDRIALVDALAKRLSPLRPLPCLIQIDIDHEPQKAGVAPEDIQQIIAAIAATPCLELRGLMAIPRPLDEVGEAGLRRSFDAMQVLGQRLGTTMLSMGMSDDFEIAIAHGATHVRVGTALFGPRQYHI